MSTRWLTGAQSENLPDRLENAGSVPGDSLAHAPLLRDEDRNTVLTGPRLVSPYLYDLLFEDQYDLLPDGSAQQKETIVHRPAADPARQMDILFAMLDDLRAAVFWIGDEALMRNPYDKTIDNKRHKIENLFVKLKGWRRIATRYDRCAHTFFSVLCSAATIAFWLSLMRPDLRQQPHNQRRLPGFDGSKKVFGVFAIVQSRHVRFRQFILPCGETSL